MDVTLPSPVESSTPFNTGSKVKNWAEDPVVRMRIRNEVVPMLQQVRSRKRPLNGMWASLTKVWTLEHETPAYEGRSNIYVPAGKKGTETLVSQLVSATFPGDDYFGVEAPHKDMKQLALDVKALLRYRIENTAKVRLGAERFYRQLAITGNSPTKIHWREKKLKQKKRERGAFSPVEKDTTIYSGPAFETLDPTNFYVFPEDVNDLRDAEVVFEDITMDLATLHRKARQGIYFAPEAAKVKSHQVDEKQLNATEKLQAQGLHSAHDMAASAYGVTDITEVYLDFDPTAGNRMEEDDPRPFLVTVSAAGDVLRAIDNPFWNKMPPYLLGRMGTMNGRVYGTGYVEAIHQLNLLLNDQTNQMMDCATYALNPIIISNPDLIVGSLPDLEPGVQFLVSDINAAMKFDRPPGDLIQYGSVLTTQTQAWLNDFIGAPPVLQGGSSPGRAFKTATGVGTAQRNAVVPLQEVVRLNEVEVWEQVLAYFFALDQQYATNELLSFFGTDKQLHRFDVRQLAGDYLFSWLASTQTSNQQVKGSQIVQLLGVLAAPGMQRMFQANGLMLNPAPLVRRLYQEVYGFRDVDDVIVQQALAAGGTPVKTPNAGELQSPEEVATETLNGPTEDLGDNAEFGGMRTDANDIAGLLGSLSGGINGGSQSQDGLTEDGEP